MAGAALVAGQFGRAGGGAHQAPAVFGIDQKGKAALLVVEQVFAPAKLLVITWLLSHAVLKADHLPRRALQRTGAAQRNQWLHWLVLLGH